MDLILTKENHFKFGYDGQPYTLRKNLDQKWTIQYGRSQRNPLDWRGECVYAAREIYAQAAGKRLWLCFSGGLDSEVVAETLRISKIPFTAAITRFKKDLNVHDISWAVAYCETHQIPYEFMELDVEDFYLSGEIWEYATDALCVFPMLTPTMKLMEWVCKKKGGFPILGSADCVIQKNGMNWVAVESESIAAMFRFQMARKLNAVSGFFVWSPELILSFMLDPLIQKLTQNKIREVTSSAYIKHKIYSQYFPLLEPREKYLGFEKIRKLDAEMNKKLEAKIIVGLQAFYYPYEQLVQDLKNE